MKIEKIDQLKSSMEDLVSIRADFDEVSREQSIWEFYQQWENAKQQNQELVFLNSFAQAYTSWLTQDCIARTFGTGQKCLDGETYGRATQSLMIVGNIVFDLANQNKKSR